MKTMATASAETARQWPGLLGKIFTPERRRFIKFAIVGSSGVLVNLLVVWLAGAYVFAAMPDRELAAKLIFLSGIVVSIFTNFVINDTWTWGDRPKNGFGHWLQRCRDFYIAASIAAAVQWGVCLAARGALQLPAEMTVLGITLTDMDTVRNLISSVAGIAVATPINYVVNHFWTFRRKPVKNSTSIFRKSKRCATSRPFLT